MINCKQFTELLGSYNFTNYIGVPCSYFTALVNQVVADPALSYINATSEGEALSLAAGMWLAGKKPVVIAQNSGLGNMVSPLTSLNYPFQIPALLLVTWRGQPGQNDEPQHELMGRITPDLLDLMGVRYEILHKDFVQASEQIAQAERYMEYERKPFAFIIEKNTFTGGAEPVPSVMDIESLCSRYQVLEAIVETVPESCPIIATTGKTGRELFTVNDRINQLYCVGSMGYVNAIGAGMAMGLQRQVFVIDGDGAAMMHMGNMATIGSRSDMQLVHVILDNGSYDSTGGQPSISPQVDFMTIGKGCGYRHRYEVSELGEIKALLTRLVAEQILPNQAQVDTHAVLVVIKIKPGSLSGLGRPTRSPTEIATRFQSFFQTS